MKYFIFSIGLILLSGQMIAQNPAPQKSKPSASGTELKALRETLIKAYKWQETHFAMADYDPVSDSKEEKYIGLDFKIHQKRLKELENSGFFSQEFIKNYAEIGKGIHNRLKSQKEVWLVGNMSPFGDDSNPWCRCQDYPSDEPWAKLVVKNLDLKGDTATFYWTWGDTVFSKGFAYKVRMQKVDGRWKISYLQGFDKKVYFHS